MNQRITFKYALKNAIILALFVTILGTALLYTRTQLFSAVGVPYGGLMVTPFPCPCSPPLILLSFAPGFIGPVPGAFQATYIAGSQMFAYWNMGQAGTWAVGNAVPSLPDCLVFAPHSGCFPVGFPVLFIEPFTGTSLTI